MPTVDPTAPGAGPATRETREAADGFADVLADVGSPARAGARLTLGEMLGLPAARAGGSIAATAGTDIPQASGTAGDAIAAAERYLGVPYKWGGTDPATGLDCSGFLQRAFDDVGVDLPRVSADQARAGEPVDGLDNARPGDLVYWSGRGGRSNHIGLYLGDGRMMHAPRTGDVVKVDSVRSAPPDAIRRVA